jgi:hypothetical protein
MILSLYNWNVKKIAKNLILAIFSYNRHNLKLIISEKC